MTEPLNTSAEAPAPKRRRDRTSSSNTQESSSRNHTGSDRSITQRYCVCCDIDCQPLAARVKEILGPDRCGYVEFPQMPKIPRIVTDSYQQRVKRVERFYHYLPDAEPFITQRLADVAEHGDPTVKEKLRFAISLWHFHPKIIEFYKGLDTKNFPTSIPADVARLIELPESDLKYGATDTLLDDYIAVPSYSSEDLKNELSCAQHIQESSVMDDAPADETILRSGLIITTGGRNSADNSQQSSAPSSLSSSVHIEQFSLTSAAERWKRRILESNVDTLALQLADMELCSSRDRTYISDLNQRLQRENKMRIQIEGSFCTHVNTYISRPSLCNPEFYLTHRDAANFYFGFCSWSETLAYIEALFAVVPTTTSTPNVNTPLTSLEELLLSRMFMKRGFELELLAHIWGKSKQLIGRVLKRRVADWGEAGQDLSDLDLTLSYGNEERPACYAENQLDKVAVLLDGKIFKSNSIRQHSALLRAQHSSKVSWSGFLSLNFQTPAGLSVYHTPPCLARTSETNMIKWIGSKHGTLTPAAQFIDEEGSIPVEMTPLFKPTSPDNPLQKSRAGWRGSRSSSSNSHSNNSSDTGMAFFTDSSGSNVDSRESRVSSSQTTSNLSRRQSRVNLSRTTSSSTMETVSHTTTLRQRLQEQGLRVINHEVDRDDERVEQREHIHDDIEISSALANRTTNTVPEPTPVDDAVQWFQNRVQRVDRNRPDLTVNGIVQFNEEELKKTGPNSSASRKQRQLERFLRLDDMYHKQGRLELCLLSYYIDKNRELIKAMKDYLTGQQNNPVRLGTLFSKFAVGTDVLADRGFVFITLSLPHANKCVTPAMRNGRAQFTYGELTKDMKTCMLRYGIEVSYSRVATEESLSGEIRYALFKYLPHLVDWAHANTNLHQPLQNPTDWYEYIDKITQERDRT